MPSKISKILNDIFALNEKIKYFIASHVDVDLGEIIDKKNECFIELKQVIDKQQISSEDIDSLKSFLKMENEFSSFIEQKLSELQDKLANASRIRNSLRNYFKSWQEVRSGLDIKG